jgi:hypothetical protein
VAIPDRDVLVVHDQEPDVDGLVDGLAERAVASHDRVAAVQGEAAVEREDHVVGVVPGEVVELGGVELRDVSAECLFVHEPDDTRVTPVSWRGLLGWGGQQRVG